MCCATIMGGESIVVDTKNGCRMLKVNICLFGYLVHVLFEWEISMLQAVKQIEVGQVW